MMRHIVTTIALLLIMLSTGGAMGQTAKDLAGTWAWVSLDLTRPDGTKIQPMGANPKGYTIFDGNNHFVSLIARADRPKFASNRRDVTTPEEDKATVQGSVAFAGAYSVNGNTLNWHVDGSTFPNAEGSDQKRLITLTGDELRWTNAAPEAGGQGAKTEAVFFWATTLTMPNMGPPIAALASAN